LDAEEMAERVLRALMEGRVKTVDGNDIEVAR
jgi:lactam utilization protein B